MKKLLSKCELKASVRNNWKLWLILTAVLCFFISVMTLVAPNMAERSAQRPNGGDGGGLGGGGNFSLISLYANGIFGMMGVLLMLIYAITVGNKLVASEVDKGTMSFTLNTQITRKQVIFSKALFYISSLFAMALMVGLFGTILGSIVNVEMEYGKFWLLVLGFFLYGIAISGICFFASCWFNKSGNSLMLGAGVTIAFFLFNSLATMGVESLEFLKYFSLNTLFDTSAIISGGNFIIQFIAMFVIGVALYVVGINKFLRKDLPL